MYYNGSLAIFDDLPKLARSFERWDTHGCLIGCLIINSTNLLAMTHTNDFLETFIVLERSEPELA